MKDLKHLVNCGNKIDSKLSIFGEAPIHKAVLTHVENKLAALATIIECKADVDNMDSNGWTALHHAAHNGDLESAQQLLNSGAKVNSYSNQQKTPLHFAAMNNHTQVIQLLISRNAEIEWNDEQKCTPLHLACKKGNLESVALLLNQGANIYAQDFRQWTPLHYGSYNGYRRVCNYLLKWEADKDTLRDMKNSQGRIALNIAKSPETKKGFTRKTLASLIYILALDIWRACRDGDLDLVRILIREGQDYDEQTQYLKNTPMHIAAKNGHYLIVKYLIEIGASPREENRDGLTPYDYATEAKRNLELQLASTKHKIGGPGLDIEKAKVKLDNLNTIVRQIARSEEGKSTM